MTGPVWDAFMFNDELDLLELRLRELDPVVDRFLIVESARSHAGRPKPLWFAEHEQRFHRWRDKIRHEVVPVDEFADSRWRREEQHRRGVRRVLEEEAADASLILFGDVDELPDPEVVPWLEENVADEPVRLRLTHAVYYANWHLAEPWDNSTLAFRADQLDAPMVRPQLGDPHDEWDGYSELQLEDAGVHLQYVGGAELTRTKWATFTHEEFDNENFSGGIHLERCMELGVHFTGRHVVHRRTRDDVGPHLARLATDVANEWLFDFSSPPDRREVEAYCGYTWLRAQPRFPRSVVRTIDRHPAVRRSVRVPLVALHRGLARRRERNVQADWRSPRRITWARPESATPGSVAATSAEERY